MQCCLSRAADGERGPGKEQAKYSVLALAGRSLDLGNRTLVSPLESPFAHLCFDSPRVKWERYQSLPTPPGRFWNLPWCLATSSRPPSHPKSAVGRRSKPHTSPPQCSAELVLDTQVVRSAKHQTRLSSHAYNKKRGIFINSQIFCALYLW